MLKLILFTLLSIIYSSETFTIIQSKLIQSLNDDLNIKNNILLKESIDEINNNILNYIKNNSFKNIYVSVLSISEINELFRNYYTQEKHYNKKKRLHRAVGPPKTMVILNSKNFNKIGKLLFTVRKLKKLLLQVFKRNF